MVIIRESPRRNHLSPAKSATTQWPPASPFQALMSSPSGRKKWSDIRSKSREASPSPRKQLFAKNTSTSLDDASSDSTDDDEESLKLKLEILETKRKLRELKRKKRDHSSDKDQERTSRPDIAIDGRLSPQKRRRLLLNREKDDSNHVAVPLSPAKRLTQQQSLPASPARVRLGLDKLAKAADVSLKRSKSSIRPTAEQDGAQVGTNGRHAAIATSSFSERITQARENQKSQLSKSERLQSIRSKTFGTIRNKAESSLEPLTDLHNTKSTRSTTSSKSSFRKRQDGLNMAVSEHHSDCDASESEISHESYSNTHLSKRHIAPAEVARSLAGVEIYTLSRLLKEVKAPDYEPPDCESDYAVFGILASKSSPFDQKASHKTRDINSDGNKDVQRHKFMVLKLCDLKWEVDCYLFGSGFDRFWKLTEGTLLAILNPGILPPRTNTNSGRFSLKVASSEEKVLEIGIARDLGYCSSVKKDGSACNTWVNIAKTSVCEFHLNLEINQSRKGRMEVNGMWRGETNKKPEQRAKTSNVDYHPEYGRLYTYNGMAGKSAASLLDADDIDKLHNMTQEEASRKRIAAAQRERDIAKNLTQLRTGVAGDYFRAAHGISSLEPSKTNQEERIFKKPTASELGLLSRDANEQRLSPAKDRRRHFGLGAVSSAGTDALGWGGARKSNLLQPRATRLGSPEGGQTKISLAREKSARTAEISESPSKKTRFMLKKGIREPGRESGGHELMNKPSTPSTNNENVDVDDLEIV